LQLLKALMPQLSRVGQLVNPNAAAARLNIELTREAAARLGFAVQLFEARSVEELERAFDTMAAASMQAVTVNPEGLAFQARELLRSSRWPAGLRSAPTRARHSSRVPSCRMERTPQPSSRPPRLISIRN